MFTEMIETRKFFIRDPNGKPVEVEGVPITIPSLPEWKFFVWQHGLSWLPSEVRTGAKFPYECEGMTPKAAEKLTRAFCLKRGKEKCEKVFQVVLDKYGDLPVFIEPPKV